MANSNTINVKQLMKDLTKFNVSQKAVDELKDFIANAWFDHAMSELESIAKRDNRSTILERDVIDYLNHIKAYIIRS